MSLKTYCAKRRHCLRCNCFYIPKALLKDLQEGQLNLRAMGLVFTTFLSLVPLLAFSFSILKAFGVHNQMEPMLLQLLEPLGAQGVEIASHIVEFVGNMKVGVMGTFGLLILIYTVISLTRKVESAFNFTWRVDTHRKFMERFSHYISVIVVGPVLMFSALGLSASFMSTEFVQSLSNISPFGTVITAITKQAPTLLIILAFSFSYWFIPNTRVKLKPAIIAGIIAGSLWQLAGWAFATYITHSNGQTAVYSVFTGLFFFFIWMYVGWVILLIGSSIACYIQHPEYARYRHNNLLLAGRDQARLAVAIVQTIAKRHYQKQLPYTLNELQEHFKIPEPVLNRVLKLMVFHEILVMSQDEPPRYLPLKPMSEVRIEDVINAVEKGSKKQIESAEKMLDEIPELTHDAKLSFKELVKEALIKS